MGTSNSKNPKKSFSKKGSGRHKKENSSEANFKKIRKNNTRENSIKVGHFRNFLKSRHMSHTLHPEDVVVIKNASNSII